MTAELLREAATLMREGAVAANACGMVSDCTDPAHAWYPLGELRSRFSDARRGSAAAEYIASWHPAVTLAVADSLDESAREWGVLAEVDDVPCEHPCCSGLRRALAVARAYLGGDR